VKQGRKDRKVTKAQQDRKVQQEPEHKVCRVFRAYKARKVTKV
jgi:hypothetical protein